MLINSLKDTDNEVRVASVYALARIGSRASSAIPALIETLKDSDISVRDSVINALGNIGSDNFSIMPPLLEVFTDKNGGFLVFLPPEC